MQVAAAVEQFELQPGQLRQVVRAKRAVFEDEMPRDPARVNRVQPAQVAHDLLHRLAVGLHAPAAVFPRVVLRFLAHQLEQRVGVGQARRVAHGDGIELGRQLDLVAHQHQHVRLAVATLHDVAQLPLRAGVAKVWMEIEQHVDAALAGVADRLQRVGGVGRDLRRILAIQVDAAQALGDRPAVQGAPDVHQRLPEEFDHAGFVAGLDDDERSVGADQRGQILQFGHRRAAHPCRSGDHSGRASA